jgi:crossover junction endodeoxyribonuclease RuvC
LRILGLDPGVATTGFGVIEAVGAARFVPVAFGTIRTPAGLPIGQRLRTIRDDLAALVTRHRPQRAALEMLYFNKNVRTAMAVGEVRGVLLLTLDEQGVPVSEYGPAEVKKAVVGYGRGDKRQVGAQVARLLGLATAPRPDDVADALAIALCHALAWRFHCALEGAGKRKTAVVGNRSFAKEGGV